MRDELGTAEAALGRVGRAGVCEHDEGAACRRVDLIASYREKGKNLRVRKAEELSQASTNNILHGVRYFGSSTHILHRDLRFRKTPDIKLKIASSSRST